MTTFAREPARFSRHVADHAATRGVRRKDFFGPLFFLLQTREDTSEPRSSGPIPVLPSGILTNPEAKEDDISICDPAPTIPLWGAVVSGDELDLVPVGMDGGPGVSVQWSAGHWIWLEEFDEGQDVAWESGGEDEETEDEEAEEAGPCLIRGLEEGAYGAAVGVHSVDD